MRHPSQVFSALLITTCLCWFNAVRAQAQTNSATSSDQLKQRLTQFVQQPRFASSQWGIQIKSLDTGKLVFEHDSQKRLKPASNNKLYTGALALEELGPDYRIITSIAAKKKPSKSGTLSTDLVIIGRGDFSFSSRFHEGDREAALRPLIDAIVSTGIKRIHGDIVADESFFRGPSFGNAWTWDDLQYYYGAEVSACTYQDNTVDLAITPGKKLGDTAHIELKPFTPLLQFINRVQTAATNARASITVTREPGSNLVTVTGRVPLGGKAVEEAVTVPRPALWFAQAVKDALIKRGIPVKGDVRRITADDKAGSLSKPDDLIELTSVSSPPMRELVKHMMKPSQNLYAQLLLLQVAARHADHAKDLSATTEDIGVRRMSAFMQKIGVTAGDVLIEEGSGLSRGALVTPRATVKLLEYMAKHTYKDAYLDSLPIAGKDGTLRLRMKGTLAEGNVQAKTGSLRYVNALSGYVTNRTGERFVFSLLSNAHIAPVNGPSARNDLDQIVLWLAESGFKTVK
ncbi:MAG TPA: D-alanyl-D-alanine carboxypeptidase/D-alanyl-D-alanine-endopeptidase [Verrucomicrobiae bacterium]